MAMCASRVVGCESKWEVVKRVGGSEVGGIESRRVVEVPRERMASPGEESATTVAGLSPVKGAIKQRIDLNDIGGMNMVAGFLIKQISQGHKPLDLSREENLVIFRKDVEG